MNNSLLNFSPELIKRMRRAHQNSSLRRKVDVKRKIRKMFPKKYRIKLYANE